MPIPFAGLQDETIFSGLNGCVAGWALLVLAPRWQHTQGLVLAIVAVYCALYVATLAGHPRMRSATRLARGPPSVRRVVRECRRRVFASGPQARSPKGSPLAAASRLSQRFPPSSPPRGPSWPGGPTTLHSISSSAGTSWRTASHTVGTAESLPVDFARRVPDGAIANARHVPNLHDLHGRRRHPAFRGRRVRPAIDAAGWACRPGPVSRHQVHVDAKHDCDGTQGRVKCRGTAPG